MIQNRHLPVPGLLVAGVFAFTIILIVTILGAQPGGFGDLLKAGSEGGVRVEGIVTDNRLQMRTVNGREFVVDLVIMVGKVNGKKNKDKTFASAALWGSVGTSVVDRHGNDSHISGVAVGDRVRVVGRKRGRVDGEPVMRLFAYSRHIQDMDLPKPPVRITLFSVTPDTIQQGQSATLQWLTENASFVSLDDNVFDNIGGIQVPSSETNSGTETVSPSGTTTYRLTAGGLTRDDKDVTLTVIPNP